MHACVHNYAWHACMHVCVLCVCIVCVWMYDCVCGWGGIGLFMLESTIIANIQLKLIIIIHYEKCHHKQLQKKMHGSRGSAPAKSVCVCGGGGGGGGGGAL